MLSFKKLKQTAGLGLSQLFLSLLPGFQEEPSVWRAFSPNRRAPPPVLCVLDHFSPLGTLQTRPHMSAKYNHSVTLT